MKVAKKSETKSYETMTRPALKPQPEKLTGLAIFISRNIGHSHNFTAQKNHDTLLYVHVSLIFLSSIKIHYNIEASNVTLGILYQK